MSCIYLLSPTSPSLLPGCPSTPPPPTSPPCCLQEGLASLLRDHAERFTSLLSHYKPPSKTSLHRLKAMDHLKGSMLEFVVKAAGMLVRVGQLSRLHLTLPRLHLTLPRPAPHLGSVCCV